MATTIPGSVIGSLAARLDDLELSEEEHAALAAVLEAGLRSSCEPPEVEGFGPGALASTSPNESLVNTCQRTELGSTSQTIDVTWNGGGVTMSDDWTT